MVLLYYWYYRFECIADGYATYNPPSECTRITDPFLAASDSPAVQIDPVDVNDGT